MGEIAMTLDAITFHLGRNTWTIEETMEAMNEIIELGFAREASEAFNKGIAEWHANGMPRYNPVEALNYR
jgi:hypothetical protein